MTRRTPKARMLVESPELFRLIDDLLKILPLDGVELVRTGYFEEKGVPLRVSMAFCWAMLISDVRQDLSHPVSRYVQKKRQELEGGDESWSLASASEDLRNMTEMAVEFVRGVLDQRTAEVEEWKKGFIDKMLRGKATGELFSPDKELLSHPEIRCHPRATKLAKIVAEEALGPEGVKLLKSGNVDAWTESYPNATAAFVISPKYLFQALSVFPARSRGDVPWLVGWADFTETFSHATWKDVPQSLWVDLFLDERLANEGYQEWAMKQSPELPAAELARLAHQGDSDVRSWVLRQVGRRSMPIAKETPGR